jgi:multidrug efflux system outer membrane protein
MSYRHTAISVAIAFSLSGCMLGPDYQRPDIDAPETFRDDYITEKASENISQTKIDLPAGQSLADTPWWEVFNDPALVALINEALQNNHDLKIAAARVEEARAFAGISRSALFPQIGLGLGYQKQGTSELSDPQNTATGDTYRNYNAAATLSWELDMFGRLRRQDESAIATWIATEQGRRSVLISLIADVASNYFLLRELDLELEIAKRTLESNVAQVTYYRDRLEGGVSNRLEVDQAEANRRATAATIPDIQRRIIIQENLLNFLLGKAPGRIARGISLLEQHFPPQIPAGVPLQLLERRPDVVQAEQQLVSANADIGAAKALFFPSISITGNSGRLSKDFSDLNDHDANIWNLNANITQPIFQGGRILSNYEAAKARFDQALAQYQKAVQNSFRETSNALTSIHALRDSRIEVEKSVSALRDAAALSRDRYDGGLANYLEILIADQQLFAAELQLAQLRGSEFTALVDFYRALGGGWQQDKTIINRSIIGLDLPEPTSMKIKN